MEKSYALITGASGGIGRAIAFEFASAGHNVILVARSRDSLEKLGRELAEQYGIDAMTIAMDLSAENAARDLDRRTEDRRVDNLVNNAGFGDHGVFLDSDPAKQNRMIRLNVTALTELTYYFGRRMRAGGSGRILNIASAAAFCAGPYMSCYYATKAYVLSFSQAVAEELRGTGVTVTALCPGPVSTGFEKAAGMQKPFALLRPKTAETAARRGYKAMQKGKAVACLGASVKLLDIGCRLAPRKTARKISKRINGIPAPFSEA